MGEARRRREARKAGIVREPSEADGLPQIWEGAALARTLRRFWQGFGLRSEPGPRDGGAPGDTAGVSLPVLPPDKEGGAHAGP